MQLLLYFLGHRGRQESRKMLWGDIVQCEDSTGRFLEFKERATKTRTGENTDTRERPPRAYANTKNPERCPVELYKIYAEHRPASTLNEYAPFYLAINNMRKKKATPRSWYKTSPIGQNMIGGFVRQMAIGADLSGKYTNHSVRKTLCTNLLQAGVPPTLIQQISGHKDVKSLTNYASASRQQIAQMNDILSNPGQIRSRAVSHAAGAAIPIAADDAPEENIPHEPGQIRSGAVSHAAEAAIPIAADDAPEENIPHEHENIALPMVRKKHTHMHFGELPTVTQNANTMMMGNTSTSGIFRNSSFQGCTFSFSFRK